MYNIEKCIKPIFPEGRVHHDRTILEQAPFTTVGTGSKEITIYVKDRSKQREGANTQGVEKALRSQTQISVVKLTQ